MAERPTLADLLLGRGLPSADLSRDERRAIDEDLNRPPTVWGALMPQSEEERRWHQSNPIWMYPPFTARQGGYDLARGIAEGSPWTAASGALQIGGAAFPLSLFRSTPRAPPTPPTPQGPWTPGFMNEWLASRPPPTPRHDLNMQLVRWRPPPPPQSPDGVGRTVGRLGNFLYPGVGHPPRNWREVFRASSRTAPAVSIGAAAGETADRWLRGHPDPTGWLLGRPDAPPRRSTFDEQAARIQAALDRDVTRRER